LIAAPAAQDPGRVGYVIGRKAMPRAVDRNRLRRRRRECGSKRRPAFVRLDISLRGRPGVRRIDIPGAVAESNVLLDRLVGAHG
jgi:ribonuclease P protein component